MSLTAGPHRPAVTKEPLAEPFYQLNFQGFISVLGSFMLVQRLGPSYSLLAGRA